MMLKMMFVQDISIFFLYLPIHRRNKIIYVHRKDQVWSYEDGQARHAVIYECYHSKSAF
jgi:hypothetical protein